MEEILKEFDKQFTDEDCNLKEALYPSDLKAFITSALEKQKQQYKKEFTDWFHNGTALIEDFIEEVFK